MCVCVRVYYMYLPRKPNRICAGGACIILNKEHINSGVGIALHQFRGVDFSTIVLEASLSLVCLRTCGGRVYVHDMLL